MKYLLFLAHTREDLVREVIFSLISLLKKTEFTLPEGMRVLIYTDQKPLFEEYFAEEPELLEKFLFRTITSEIVAEWKGPHNFIHRVKICMINDALRHFCSREDKLLYLDSDTYLLKSILPLFDLINEDYCLMHCNEGELEYRNNVNKVKHCRFLKGKTFNLTDKKVVIPLSTEMWNAGVIGIIGDSIGKVNDVLALNDDMYAQHPRHNIEQLAFSYVLSKAYQVLPTTKTVHHYWDHKDFKSEVDEYLSFPLSKLKAKPLPVSLGAAANKKMYKLAFDSVKQYLKDSL